MHWPDGALPLPLQFLDSMDGAKKECFLSRV
jgi:hypothetical protein